MYANAIWSSWADPVWPIKSCWWPDTCRARRTWAFWATASSVQLWSHCVTVIAASGRPVNSHFFYPSVCRSLVLPFSLSVCLSHSLYSRSFKPWRLRDNVLVLSFCLFSDRKERARLCCSDDFSFKVDKWTESRKLNGGRFLKCVDQKTFRSKMGHTVRPKKRTECCRCKPLFPLVIRTRGCFTMFCWFVFLAVVALVPLPLQLIAVVVMVATLIWSNRRHTTEILLSLWECVSLRFLKWLLLLSLARCCRFSFITLDDGCRWRFDCKWSQRVRIHPHTHTLAQFWTAFQLIKTGNRFFGIGRTWKVGRLPPIEIKQRVKKDEKSREEDKFASLRVIAWEIKLCIFPLVDMQMKQKNAILSPCDHFIDISLQNCRTKNHSTCDFIVRQIISKKLSFFNLKTEYKCCPVKGQLRFANRCNPFLRNCSEPTLVNPPFKKKMILSQIVTNLIDRVRSDWRNQIKDHLRSDPRWRSSNR